jgi:hypothetical protein
MLQAQLIAAVTLVKCGLWDQKGGNFYPMFWMHRMTMREGDVKAIVPLMWNSCLLETKDSRFRAPT